LLTTAATLTISGYGFSSTPHDNKVTFNDGVTGTVTAVSDGNFTVGDLTGLSKLKPGLVLKASVSTNDESSGTEVEVAVIEVPS
jgi:hypothetical protein